MTTDRSEKSRRFPLKTTLLGGTLILGLATTAVVASGPGDRFGDRAGGRDRAMGPVGMLCGDAAGDRLDRMTGMLANRIDLTGDQQAALESLTATVETALDDLAPTCDALADAAETGGLPGRLAQMDLGLTAMDGLLDSVTPAALAFYETLDAEQQAAIDGMIDRGPRGDRSGPRGSGRGPGAEGAPG